MDLGFGWPPHPSSCPGAQFRIPGALPASAVCLGLCSQDGHVAGALALSWWPRLQEDSLLPSSSSRAESHPGCRTRVAPPEAHGLPFWYRQTLTDGVSPSGLFEALGLEGGGEGHPGAGKCGPPSAWVLAPCAVLGKALGKAFLWQGSGLFPTA